jgi:hypothetical protein
MKNNKVKLLIIIITLTLTLTLTSILLIKNLSSTNLDIHSIDQLNYTIELDNENYWINLSEEVFYYKEYSKIEKCEETFIATTISEVIPFIVDVGYEYSYILVAIEKKDKTIWNSILLQKFSESECQYVKINLSELKKFLIYDDNDIEVYDVYPILVDLNKSYGPFKETGKPVEFQIRKKILY